MAELGDMIRAKMNAGLLPSDEISVKLWVGFGSDQACDGCGQPIQRAQVECEPEFPGKALTIRFHTG